ncbi:MAG: hypothetical protein G01um101449_168 [Parcubacteria group bacterium Gr01-1014_49]|nr:MAG: hypothetical protein G01um101449_168 [Parcubacteria group bacterium Gr01-1014_49]
MGFLLLSGGTAIPAPSKAPEAITEPGHTVTLTAYNAVPEQTDSDPLMTASGAFSNPEVVAARSVDLAEDLPFGTIIEIDGPNSSQSTCGYNVVAPAIGYRVIADAMNSRFSERIDILLSTKAEYVTVDKGMKNAAQVLGVCKGVTIRVVGYITIDRIPKTQVELAKIVDEKDSLLALNK